VKRLLEITAILAWTSFVTATPVAEDSPRGALRLVDVLAADDLASPAACPSVEYDAPPARDERIAVRNWTGAAPNPDGLTLVDVGLFVQALDDIDASTNSFHLEGFATVVWCDPRHAFDPGTEGVEMKVFAEEGASEALAHMWWPNLIAPTRLGSVSRGNHQLLVYRDGTLSYRMKLNARLTADYDFSDFPFDRQTLRIPIHGQLLREEAFTIVASERRTGFARDFNVPEWAVFGHRVGVERTLVAGDVELPRFVLEIEIGRLVGFYIWSIMVPLFAIVGVA
jgi:hypothetical protein